MRFFVQALCCLSADNEFVAKKDVRDIRKFDPVEFKYKKYGKFRDVADKAV
jgi:hypothetical protein